MTKFPINPKNPIFGQFLAHFPHFWDKKFLNKNPALSRTTHGPLTPC